MTLLRAMIGVIVLIHLSALVSSQGDRTVPPHKLFTPQVFHVGAVESLTFTSYSPERFDVTATVSYEDCSCEERRRSCKNNGQVFSTVSGKTRQGRPVKLDVQMPSISQLQLRRYFITVSSHDGEVTYYSRRQLSFSTNSFGFLLVKTDKPIYKPSQKVSFCLAFLDKTLKPHTDNADVTVRIRDAKFKQILKLDTVTIPAGDLKCLDFPLAEELNFGAWRIDVNFKVPQERGGCQAFYTAPFASCSFKVDEFVLPRFEVSLDSPGQLEREEDIQVTVRARYVFGENVQGRVKLNATLEASSRRESLPFHDKTVPLVNGRAVISIPSEGYHDMVRYRYDPFCVKSSIKLTAEVEEAGRGTKIAESTVIPLVFSPIDVKFAEDNSKIFRPGLNYTLKALASLGDGSLANGVGVTVHVATNNGANVIFNDVITSVGGAINAVISVPLDTNCMKISMRPSEGFAGACAVEQECFSPSPVFSPTRSFLQLTDVSVTSPRPNSRVDIFAESTVPFTYLHLLVIAQGSIQEHTFELERGGVTTATVSFRVTHEMVPKVKVLGLFAREDGELVADLIELTVACDLKNDVHLSFSGDIVEPGTPVSVRTVTEPGSVVLVSVVDKSLSLLAEACKSLEKDNVCRLLRELTRGSLSGGSTCNTATEGRCCPDSCSEPTSVSINSILNAAGVSLYSNMFRPNPPAPPRPPPRPFVPDYLFSRIPGPEGPAVVVTDDRVESIVPSPVETEEEAARVFFPESWIFQLLKADAEGNAIINSVAPDTITTWFGEAFSLSKTAGLGISRQSQITVSKPFFVSLELPFSINFGESVTITPLVFFFGLRASTVVTISVTVDDDLDVRDLSLPTSGRLTLTRGEGGSFSFKLHPRAIGQLQVTISAVTDEGETDVVRKPLFVKPGCDKFDITENVFAEGAGQGRYCFNYSLPNCVISGSASARIAVTGDLMSPPDLDRLLVLPSGCGEQNLVRTAVNWVVAGYLQSTGQLQDFLEVKIRNNIMTGYQRQLNYLQGTGCFAIWPRADCSLWLTAAVVDVFSGIVGYYDRQEPGTEIIDMSVINGALNYVINNQRKTGEIPIIGRVHSFSLFRTGGSISHTAFGIVALKQYLQTFPTSPNAVRTRNAVQNAQQYIENEFEEEAELCNYGLALSAYALQGTVPSKNTAVKNGLISALRSRITTSKTYPGTCFLCPGCPSDRPSTPQDGTDCSGRPRAEGSAACVETTAYALLALRQVEGENQFTVCLAQWLIRIRGDSGGFYSSQDTVIAMKALSGFAQDTFTRELNKIVTFDLPALTAAPLSITPGNRYERNTINVPSVPSDGNCVNWSGFGTVIIQSTLTYHGCSCCSDVRAFSLQLASERSDTPLGTLLTLSVRIRYLGGESSDMAIVDVEIPSGYLFSHHELADQIAGAELERFEPRGTSVVFYFNNVPGNLGTSFTVHFSRAFVVETPQQLPVTVYDYYDPGQSITDYYLPVSTSPLPPIGRPSLSTPPPPTRGVPGPSDLLE
ncbi:C3 and PZP-like alpha-2-macroglobulin domain-containing protein 8 [Halichondria panicea]|uniref:C3 and PZP-like alpha-2-macroglobulin domain-containing protein 8 n=1 Tax=Halichondria panicea TaxID=6063 RepID=UPI00312B6577